MRYYLLLDQNVQWFWILVSFDGEQLINLKELPLGLECEFLASLLERDKVSVKINTGNHFGTYSGVSVSAWEFSRIEKLIFLYPSHLEFVKLAKLPV